MTLNQGKRLLDTLQRTRRFTLRGSHSRASVPCKRLQGPLLRLERGAEQALRRPTRGGMTSLRQPEINERRIQRHPEVPITQDPLVINAMPSRGQLLEGQLVAPQANLRRTGQDQT